MPVKKSGGKNKNVGAPVRHQKRKQHEPELSDDESGQGEDSDIGTIFKRRYRVDFFSFKMSFLYLLIETVTCSCVIFSHVMLWLMLY